MATKKKSRKKPVSKRISPKSSASKKNCRKAGSLTRKGSSVGGKVLKKCATKKLRKKK